MTVAELISLLEDQDPDAEVMLAHQPSWPLREVVQDVRVATDDDVVGDDEDDEEDTTVYLVAGGHPYEGTPYAPRNLWD